jgi:DNA-binding NtrC family response regulator
MSRLLALLDDGDELVFGPSPASNRLESQIDRIARTPGTTVLLKGERGRELELTARAIHARSASDGAAYPFLALACATLAPGRGRPALAPLFESVEGGTLFLNGVGDLHPDLQDELFERQEERAGETPGAGLTRLVASTSVDLEAAVEEQRFRADLLYRLNVLTVRVPALRERLEDLPGLAGAILRRLGTILGREATLAPSTLDVLVAHAWPGNLLELEASLACALQRSPDGVVLPAHLQLSDPAPGSETLIPAPPGTRSLRDLEEAMIRRVLDEEAGNRSRAARALGINRTTLYNKLRQYGIA